MVENFKKYTREGSLEWQDVHVKFHENPLIASEVIRLGQTHGHDTVT
jgi:hypothetical protein